MFDMLQKYNNAVSKPKQIQYTGCKTIYFLRLYLMVDRNNQVQCRVLNKNIAVRESLISQGKIKYGKLKWNPINLLTYCSWQPAVYYTQTSRTQDRFVLQNQKEKTCGHTETYMDTQSEMTVTDLLLYTVVLVASVRAIPL